MTNGPKAAVTTPLLIFPYNGNGVEALDCLGDRYRFVGFVDDTLEKQNSRPFGFDVFTRSAFDDFREARVLAVPGGPTSFRARRQVIGGLALDEDRFACVVHPTASVSPRAKIGKNTLIMAGVVISGTAVIGDHVCILPNTVIHHDVTVGDWTLLGSNVTIAGGVTVGENCYIGSGSRIMNGLRIGAEALLGIGSNAIRDVAQGCTVVGNPARPI